MSFRCHTVTKSAECNLTVVITYRAKLLNADWLRQRAFFLNHDLEGTFGNQERAWLLDADWPSTPALGWFPALASNGFSETHRFCELRVWSKQGYFILSWKRINLQQNAVFWWKSKRIFPTKTVLIRSEWVGNDWCWTKFMAAKLKVAFFVLLRVALLILQLTLSA